MNLAACAALPRTPENGVWYRLIDLTYLSTALSAAHTKKACSRFNAGTFLAPADQFSALYFADDPLVALFEAGALLGNPGPGGHVPHPRRAWVNLNVQIILHEVADVTDVNTAQIPLGTTAQELTGDWRGYQIRNYFTPVSSPTGTAPTQDLGQALFTAGVEGFRATSARVPYHKILTVFTDNFLKGSSLKFFHNGNLVHSIP